MQNFNNSNVKVFAFGLTLCEKDEINVPMALSVFRDGETLCNSDHYNR